MTKSRAALNSRLPECLVCGKTFPKGISDLKAHAAASTLLHYVSDCETSHFQHHCEKCDSYFSCIEHLDMHNTHCTCGKSDDDSVEFDDDCYTAKYRVSDSDEENDSDEDEDEDSDDNTQGTETEDKTMECFICGKLFPRGPIDLARHANAVTLKHLVSNRKSNEYKYGCTVCNRYFTTEEHLQMHTECSTCNPDMAWPPNASTTAGLRTVHKSTLPVPTPGKSNGKNGSKIERKSSSDDVTTSNSSAAASSLLPAVRERKQSQIDSFFYKTGTTSSSKKSSSSAAAPGTPRGSTSKAMSMTTSKSAVKATPVRSTAGTATPTSIRPTRSITAPASAAAAAAASGGGAESRVSARLIDSANRGTSESTTKRKISSILADIPLKIIKSKKARHIIPQERKAFFAIISLLIAQSGANVDNIQITNDNYDMFIHEKDRELVNKLQSLLHYTI